MLPSYPPVVARRPSRRPRRSPSPDLTLTLTLTRILTLTLTLTLALALHQVSFSSVSLHLRISPYISATSHQVSFSSVSKRFVNELNLLLGELGSSKVSFIRCVR